MSKRSSYRCDRCGDKTLTELARVPQNWSSVVFDQPWDRGGCHAVTWDLCESCTKSFLDWKTRPLNDQD